MTQEITNFFDSENFLPHGHCFLWEPRILWLHILSDMTIAAAYYSIPVALVYLVWKRKDLPFGIIFWLFAAFILLCGTTHIMSIWVLWNPNYAVEGVLKAGTGIVSIATFIVTVKLIPRVLLLAGPTQLAVLNGELHSLLDKLAKSNVELEAFAYAASHDLKAPLRVIDNASKWLEEDLQEHLTDETRENMNLMRGRIGRMENLLDDLLDYSRIGRTVDERYAEVITGDVLVENILALLSPPKDFKVKVSPSLAAIHVCRMPLQQILMNLICNAIKHHDKKEGCIEVTGEDHGGHYEFAVKDDGPGIAAQFHDQVFKMFQTLKPKDQVEGSGMGLALVSKNIEVFGGTINLESSEGKGSTFRFTWPIEQHIKGVAA